MLDIYSVLVFVPGEIRMALGAPSLLTLERTESPSQILKQRPSVSLNFWVKEVHIHWETIFPFLLLALYLEVNLILDNWKQFRFSFVKEMHKTSSLEYLSAGVFLVSAGLWGLSEARAKYVCDSSRVPLLSCIAFLGAKIFQLIVVRNALLGGGQEASLGLCQVGPVPEGGESLCLVGSVGSVSNRMSGYMGVRGWLWGCFKIGTREF